MDCSAYSILYSQTGNVWSGYESMWLKESFSNTGLDFQTLGWRAEFYLS